MHFVVLLMRATVIEIQRVNNTRTRIQSTLKKGIELGLASRSEFHKPGGLLYLFTDRNARDGRAQYCRALTFHKSS